MKTDCNSLWANTTERRHLELAFASLSLWKIWSPETKWPSQWQCAFMYHIGKFPATNDVTGVSPHLGRRLAYGWGWKAGRTSNQTTVKTQFLLSAQPAQRHRLEHWPKAEPIFFPHSLRHFGWITWNRSTYLATHLCTCPIYKMIDINAFHFYLFKSCSLYEVWLSCFGNNFTFLWTTPVPSVCSLWYMNLSFYLMLHSLIFMSYFHR